MVIKRKSLAVALISGSIISAVLVLTLIGYVVYIGLKDEEMKISYQDALRHLNSRIYSKNIEISRLNARLERAGPLKGYPVLEGLIKNNGARPISNLLIKVKFMDRDNAVIYEMLFRPQEVPLGTGILTQVAIPYIYGPSRGVIKPGSTLPFKKILNECPPQIIDGLKAAGNSSRLKDNNPAGFDVEVLSVDF